MAKKKRTQLAVNVRGHTVFSRDGDVWTAHFATLDVSGAGASEDDAWKALMGRLDEVTNAGDASVSTRWQTFCQDNIIEIEMTDDDVAAERERRATAEQLAEGRRPHFRALTARTFDDAVESPTPTLVDFWAAWCEPCLAMIPALETVAARMGSRIVVASVDVEAEEALWEQMDLRGIPTMILFAGGRELGRLVGTRSADDLERELEALIASASS